MLMRDTSPLSMHCISLPATPSAIQVHPPLPQRLATVVYEFRRVARLLSHEAQQIDLQPLPSLTGS